MSNQKESNPKQQFADAKVQFHVLPMQVVAELSVAMLEGATKYGSHNYRKTGARFSTYYNATMRHLVAYLEGEDVDRESGVNHITKAITSLMVLRDCMLNDIYVDDRPISPACPCISEANDATANLLYKMKDVEIVRPYTREEYGCIGNPTYEVSVSREEPTNDD